jgi:hypothetical protein
MLALSLFIDIVFCEKSHDPGGLGQKMAPSLTPGNQFGLAEFRTVWELSPAVARVLEVPKPNKLSESALLVAADAPTHVLSCEARF